MSKRRRWTAEELAFLHEWYEKKGPTWCARRLGRTPAQVAGRAAYDELRFRDAAARADRVALAAYCKLHGLPLGRLKRRAQAEGVLVHGGIRSPRKAGERDEVPLAWAERVRREVGETLAVEKAPTWAYYPSETVMRAFGVRSRHTLYRALRGEGTLAPYLAKVRWCRVGEGHYRFNAADVEAQARAYREAQRQGAAPKRPSAGGKLTEEKVLAILRRLDEGATQASIAREFGVAQPTVYKLDRGILWRHLTAKRARRLYVQRISATGHENRRIPRGIGAVLPGSGPRQRGRGGRGQAQEAHP